ncbi:glycosyl hydrolase [Chloracidobacterium validum]|uniref:Glycosyl hydrolase n=2 Tax=Chloracidobacterium validum TaxID=2821543 RepID=A0ABX8BG81_9BACT|nr:glycosyl hydrolase [Chloracidobacterium validum]
MNLKKPISTLMPIRSLGFLGWLTLVCLILSIASVAPAQQPATKSVAEAKPAGYASLKYRQIGPFRGGRVGAVTGVVGQPNLYYFGATGGGVWKSTDGGVNWQPLGDGTFRAGSVGALAVAPSDPNVIYVGMGEHTWRGNMSHGDGVYKSTDAGRTWRRVGLGATRHIARIRVHPSNPEVVYVAAMGHGFGPNEERGVYRSTDGGKTWQRILFVSAKAGCADLAMDPTNPRILYAGMWEAQRGPYFFTSGGPGSGLWKSVDGGDTWQDLTRKPGLPKGTLGKICVTVSPVNSDRLWASVEADEGGIFRSDDGGNTWTRTTGDRNLRQRAWYFSRVQADPKDANVVYALNVQWHRSSDGGRTFTPMPTTHADHHDLWIAPDDPQRMILGNDGGASVSTDGGRSWTEQDQPTAQFYRVALDNQFPFFIYGAQQDNTTVAIASRTMRGFGIGVRDWSEVGGGESGWIAPHPTNPDIVLAGSYGGLLTHYDRRTGQTRDVTVYPENPMGAGAESMKYRFQWNFPILFSPHPPHALYAAGNRLFRSDDEGASWRPISPDLTRNDPAKLGPSGGPITKDNTSVEYYCTIFALAESPKAAGVLWAGTDDGLVHLSRDGGATWENVTPKGLPEWIQINAIEASPHEPGAAYLAATMYKHDDFAPYLYKTTDYGKTWTNIVNGIAPDAFTRVIREDPRRRGLLYAGTETGMYVSFDDGANWRSLQLNLPAVPITDLAVHPRDNVLVVATQGRSFWALDDLAVLQQYAERPSTGEVRLYAPETALRLRGFGGFTPPPTATVGTNPPVGVSVFFELPEKPFKRVTLTFEDADGKPLRTFTGKPKDEPEAALPAERGEASPDTFTYEPGLNRFVWDMRLPGATRVPGMVLWAGDLRGPRVLPGRYRVTLKVDDVVQTQGFEIRTDPRLSATPDDLKAQFELLVAIRDKVSETHQAILSIRDARRQIEDVEARLRGRDDAKSLLDLAKSLKEKLTAIEETLVQTKIQSGQDPLNYPIRLNNKLAALTGVVDSADAAPTAQAREVFADLSAKIDVELQKLRDVLTRDLGDFNAKFQSLGLPRITPRTGG